MNVLEINNAFFNPKYRLVYITFQVKLRFLFWILEILKCSQKSLDYLAKVLCERAKHSQIQEETGSVVAIYSFVCKMMHVCLLHLIQACLKHLSHKGHKKVRRNCSCETGKNNFCKDVFCKYVVYKFQIVISIQNV